MEKQENKGYQITDSIQVGNTAFVIGHSEKLPYPYVVWKKNEAQGYNYGHYKNHRQEAVEDLCRRALKELKIQRNKEMRKLRKEQTENE